MMFALVLWSTLTATQPAATAFESGDFDGALTLISKALPSEPSAKERSKLKLLKAQCLAALRRPSEVDEAIEAALNEDPALEVDADVSPGFQASVLRVRTQLAGTVTVTTTPPGLAIRLNGALIGKSPLTQVLPVGRHSVVALDTTGAEAETRVVLVPPRQSFTVSLEVKKTPSAVVVAPGPTEPSAPLTVAPLLAGRLLVDPLAPGVAFEVGVGAIGKHWLAELDFVAGGLMGVGVRAGGRLPFANDLLSVQLTADGTAFFGPSVAAAIGATASVGVRPTNPLEVLLDVGGRWALNAGSFREGYVLVGLSARLRWPFAQTT